MMSPENKEVTYDDNELLYGQKYSVAFAKRESDGQETFLISVEGNYGRTSNGGKITIAVHPTDALRLATNIIHGMTSKGGTI